MASSEYQIIVAGHMCLDVIPDLGNLPSDKFQALFKPGRLVQVGAAFFSAGGPVSNTGLALDRLGVNTRLMGKVGDDFLGQTLQAVVGRYNPHLIEGMLVSPEVSTSYTLVFNMPGADRIFLHYPGANDTFQASDVRYDLVAKTRLFHFGYPPIMQAMYENQGDQLARMFEQAKATGVTTSLDMSLPDPSSASGRAPWPAILRSTLPNVDVFLPSGEEILFMLRRETYDQLYRSAGGGDILPLITTDMLTELSDSLLDMGARIVGIKLGHRGLYVRTGSAVTLEGLGRCRPENLAGWADKEIWAPAFLVEEVGATGAGDTAIAGFLTSLLRGTTLEEAVIMAAAVGACNVEAADGLSGVRSWDDTLDRIQAGWPQRDLALHARGWEFDGDRLWIRQG